MGQSSQTTSNQSTNQNTQGFGSGQQTLSPLMQQFQNQLMPQIQQGINQANQPLYGQAQVASNLQNLNQLANSSIKQLQGNLARTGGLQGGGNAQGVSDILQSKNAQAGQFAQNVPMMNRQATMQALPGMFGAANSLLSTAPKGYQQTSGSTMAGSSQGQQNTSSPWWQSALQGIGGAMMFM